MSDRKATDSPIKDLEYRRKKVEDYGSTLAQIRARVKANRAACPKKEVEDGEENKEGIIEEISERCQTFKKLVEEDRLKMAEIEKDRPKIQATVEALKKDKEVWKQREQRIQLSLAKQNAAPLEVPTEVKKKLLDMEDLISDLKEKLAAKEKVISSQVQAFKALNDQLSDRTKEFYEKVEQMSSSVTKIEAEHASHEEMLKKQIDMYKEELQEAVLQTNAKEKECKRLLGVEKELKSLKEEHSECTSKMDQMKNQIESMNTLVVKLKVQLKNTKSERDDLLQKQDDHLVKELKNKVALLEEEKGNWQLQLIDYDEIKGKYEETLTQTKLLEEKVVSLEKSNSELTIQKDMFIENSLKEKDEQICSLENSLQLAKETVHSLKEQWKSDVEEATEKLQQAIDLSDKNRSDLEETIKSLENEKNALLSEMKIREESYEENFTSWENTKSLFEKERADLQGLFDLKEKELKEMLNRVSQLEKMNATLVEEKDVLISTNLQDGAKLQEFVDRIESLGKSNELLTSENMLLNERLMEEESQLVTSSKLVRELEVKLGELLKGKDSTAENRGFEGGQFDQFNDELKSIEKANSQFLMEQEQLSYALKEQSLRMKELEEKCEQLEASNHSLIVEKQSILNDLEAARSELAEREITIDQLQQKVAVLEERVASLASSVHSPENEELVDQSNPSQVYNSTLLSELEVLKALNEKLQEEVSQCHAKSWDTDMVLDELREANENQSISLQEKDKKIAGLEKELNEIKVAAHPPSQPPSDSDQTIKLKKLAAKCKMQAKQCKEMEGEIQRLTQESKRDKSLLEETLMQKGVVEGELEKVNKELGALKENKRKVTSEEVNVVDELAAWEDFPMEGEVVASVDGSQSRKEEEESETQRVIESKDRQIKELMERINFYEETVNFEELDKLKQMYETEFVKNDSVLSNLKVFEQELTQSRESVETMGEQLSKVKCDYEKALLNSQEREGYIETLEQDLVNMKTKMYSIESNIEDRHKEIEEKARHLEVKLEETLAKNALFLKYHEEMGQKMALFQDNENSMKETIASLTSLMNQSESRLFQIENEKRDLEEKNTQLTDQLNSLNSQLERLQEMESEIEKLTATLTMKDQTIGALEDKELQYVTKIEDISNLNQSYGEELNILRQEVQLKSEKLAQAGSEISDLIQQGEHFYSERELLQSQIASFSKKLLSLEEGLKSSCQQQGGEHIFKDPPSQEEPTSSTVASASILFSSEEQPSASHQDPENASKFFASSDDDGWGWVAEPEEQTALPELLKKVEELERERGKALSDLEEAQQKVAKLMKVVKKLKEEKEQKEPSQSPPVAVVTNSRGTLTSGPDDTQNAWKAVVEEKNTLEKQLMVMRAENYQLKARADDLEKNLAEIKPHYDLINNSLMVAQNESFSLSILLQEKETAMANLQKANDEMKEKIASLELEISEMRPKPNEDEESPAQEDEETKEPPPTTQSEDVVDTKQRETDERISNLLHSFFAQDPNATHSIFEVAQLEEVAPLQESTPQQQPETPPQDLSQTVRALEKEVESLRETNKNLQLALEEAQRTLNDSQRQLTEAFTLQLKTAQECATGLEREVDVVREEKAQLERDNHALRTEVEDALDRLKHLQDNIDRSNLLLNDSQEMTNSLQSELDLIKAENGRLKHKEANTLAELEAHQSRADTLQTDLSSLTAKLKSSEELCASLKSQLETVKAEHSQLQEMSMSGHNHLLLENEELKRLINERDSAVHQLNIQVAQESETRQALEENYLGIQSYCQQLSSTLAQQSQSLETLQGKIDEVEDAKQLLQTLLNEKQKQIDTLQRQVHMKEEESKQNQMLLEQKMSEIDSSMMALSKKDLELEQLSTILTDTQNKLVQVKEANTSENELRLQRKLDDALRVTHEQDVKFEEYSLELMRLLEERDTLQLRLSNVLRKNEELQRKCDEVTNSYPSMAPSSSALQPCQEKIGELQGTYSKDITLKSERESRHNDQMNLFSWPQTQGSPKEGNVRYEPANESLSSFSSSFHQKEEDPSESDYGFLSWFFKSPSGKEPFNRSGT